MKLLWLALLSALVLFTQGCSTKGKHVATAINAEIPPVSIAKYLKEYGVQEHYDHVDDATIIAKITAIQKDLESRWEYLLDSDKYTDEQDMFDYHTSLVREFHMLNEAYDNGKRGQDIIDYIYDSNGDTRNVRVIKGAVKLVGDCNQFQSTLMARLVEEGINPYRTQRNYARVYGNASYTTAPGGHALLTYFTEGGKCLALEQLPFPRSCKYTITGEKTAWDNFHGYSFPEGSYYDYRSYSNFFDPYGKFYFYSDGAKSAMKYDKPLIFNVPNEGGN